MSQAVIVLQARTASQRLPGKALAPIGARSIVAHCLARLRIGRAAPVILATTTNAEDDGLAALARTYGVSVFRGSEHDVLSRMLLAARSVGARYLVRATADNPAVDIGGPERLLAELLFSQADYVIEDGLPYGAAVEALTVDALGRSAALATDAFDREHVTTFVRRERARFKVSSIPAPSGVRRPDVRLTVDTRSDLRFMRQVASRIGHWKDEPGLRQIIDAADTVSIQQQCA